MGKFNKENLHLVKSLTEEGKSSPEIAEILGETVPRIDYYRSKYKWRSKYIRSKIYYKLDTIKELVEKEISDKEIAKQINCNEETIRQCRLKFNLNRRNLRLSREMNISKPELEILIGTILGDSSLNCRNNISAYFTCNHSFKQSDYINHLQKVLPSLNLQLSYRNNPRSIILSSKCSPTLYKLYSKFYINKVKMIPIELLENFTERSLAYLFMDDGSACKHKTASGENRITGFEIATCCFQLENLEEFRNFLNKKFNLDFKIRSHYNKHYNKHYYVLRLSSKDVSHFRELISPYIIDSLKYKIQSGS